MSLESFKPNQEKTPTPPTSSEMGGVPTVSNETWNTLSKEERTELVSSTAELLSKEFIEAGGVPFEDVNTMYARLPQEKLFVRREQPDRVVDALLEHEGLSITFDGGSPYANCAEWNNPQSVHGIENAFIEGYSHRNHVVAVIGFKAGKDIQVVKLPTSAQRFGELDRSLVRSISGILQPEDIVFVSLRMPAKYTKEADMTESEIEYRDEGHENGSTTFIYRGFLFGKEATRQ